MRRKNIILLNCSHYPSDIYILNIYGCTAFRRVRYLQQKILETTKNNKNEILRESGRSVLGPKPNS